MLAAFYWLIDIEGRWRWSYPLVVVGTNSIAAYCMSQLLKSWLKNSFKIHFGPGIFEGNYFDGRWFHIHLFDAAYAPIAESVAFLVFLWLVCWWMHRRKIFLRI